VLSYFVPLPTAFTDDTSTLSEIRIGRIVKFYAERGASGFVIGGPTGEGHALAIGEKKALFKYAVRSAGDKPVIATFPAITTAMTVDLALEAADAGVKHLVIVPSRHVPLTPTELAMLATVLRRHVTIPVALTLPPGMDELEGVHGVGLPQWDVSRLVGGFATGDEFPVWNAFLPSGINWAATRWRFCGTATGRGSPGRSWSTKISKLVRRVRRSSFWIARASNFCRPSSTGSKRARRGFRKRAPYGAVTGCRTGASAGRVSLWYRYR
jgi:hypothetical protein